MQSIRRQQFLTTKVMSKNCITNKNVLVSELKPLLWTLRVAGLFPYTLTLNGDFRFNVFSPVFLYSLIVIFAAMILAGVVQFDYIQRMIRTQNFRENIVNTSALIFLTPLPIIPFTHWVKVNKKVKFFNSWKEIQLSYKMTTGKTLELGLRRWAIFSIVLTVSTNCTFVSLLLFARTVETTAYYPVLYSCSLLSPMPSTWLILCEAIIRVARKSHQQLLDSVKRSCNPMMLSNYRQLWLKMCFLSHDFGYTMGLTFGGQTLIYFMYDVICVYGFLCNVKQGDAVFIIYGFAGVLVGVLIGLQCNFAHFVTDELGNKFMRMLQNLQQELSHETHSEREIFLETIKKNEPVISYCGFVQVNRSLQVSLISTMVTYLIVLMQFQISAPAS